MSYPPHNRVKLKIDGRHVDAFIECIEYLNNDGYTRWDIKAYTSPEYFYITKGEQLMNRQAYRLLKDCPGIRAGAIVREQCEDCDQDYEVVGTEHDREHKTFARGVVEESPNWFERVYALAPDVYVSRKEAREKKKHLDALGIKLVFPPAKKRKKAKKK